MNSSLKIRNSAIIGFCLSGTVFKKGGKTIAKGSRILGNTAVKTSKIVAKGSRKIASTATKKGKIDKRVLDSITIKTMNDDIEGWILSEYNGNKDKDKEFGYQKVERAHRRVPT